MHSNSLASSLTVSTLSLVTLITLLMKFEILPEMSIFFIFYFPLYLSIISQKSQNSQKWANPKWFCLNVCFRVTIFSLQIYVTYKKRVESRAEVSKLTFKPVTPKLEHTEESTGGLLKMLIDALLPPAAFWYNSSGV